MNPISETPLAQAEAKDQTIQVFSPGLEPATQGASEFFVVDVYVDQLYQGTAPAAISGGLVSFTPGARTCLLYTSRSLVEQAQVERPGDELIAFTSPIAISMERCIEVSIVRWNQVGGGCIPDENLAEHLQDYWSSGKMLHSHALDPLSTMTVLIPPACYAVTDKQSRAWPLTLSLIHI